MAKVMLAAPQVTAPAPVFLKVPGPEKTAPPVKSASSSRCRSRIPAVSGAGPDQVFRPVSVSVPPPFFSSPVPATRASISAVPAPVSMAPPPLRMSVPPTVNSAI